MNTKFSEWIPGAVDQYAWVDACGNVHDVGDAFRHLDYFAENGLFSEEYAQYLADEQSVEDEIERDLAELGPDEHPAMHSFASFQDEPRDNFYLKVYEKGWCRLGYHTWSYGKKQKFAIELYGIETALNIHKKTLLELKQHLTASVRLGIVSRHVRWMRGSNYDIKLKKL